MKQCDFILATGGEALVETAYSSGTPAIGVGVGNCVSIVTGKTPMDKVAEMIVKSKEIRQRHFLLHRKQHHRIRRLL